MSERVPVDLSAYEKRVRSGSCFICRLLRGDPGAEHELLYKDSAHVAFFNRHPTLRGCALVAPRRHVVDIVRDRPPLVTEGDGEGRSLTSGRAEVRVLMPREHRLYQ